MEKKIYKIAVFNDNVDHFLKTLTKSVKLYSSKIESNDNFIGPNTLQIITITVRHKVGLLAVLK